VLAARLLRGFEPSRSQKEARRNAVRAIEGVSKQLGNTVAVCRKSYVHPDVLDAYFDGSLLKMTEKDPELTVLALLRRRAARDVRSRAS
jgi:DNA topoisomerase-1